MSADPEREPLLSTQSRNTVGEGGCVRPGTVPRVVFALVVDSLQERRHIVLPGKHSTMSPRTKGGSVGRDLIALHH